MPPLCAYFYFIGLFFPHSWVAQADDLFKSKIAKVQSKLGPMT